jgi:hypothetical protein
MKLMLLKIDTSTQYLGQSIQINDSFFAIYDTHNGLHFFNKELNIMKFIILIFNY